MIEMNTVIFLRIVGIVMMVISIIIRIRDIEYGKTTLKILLSIDFGIVILYSSYLAMNSGSGLGYVQKLMLLRDLMILVLWVIITLLDLISFVRQQKMP